MPSHEKPTGSALRRWTALLLLTCYVLAGTGWKTQQAAPQAVVAKHPKAIKVTRRDGTRIELTSPSIEADSLVGVRAGRAPSGSSQARVSRGARAPMTEPPHARHALT